MPHDAARFRCLARLARRTAASCAVCLSHRVRLHDHYVCAVCDTTPPAPIPTPRMALDRPAHVTTTAGEL